MAPSPPPAEATILRRDGILVREGVEQARSRCGFPTDTAVALPVEGATQVLGRIDLVAAAHVSRPSEASLRVAFLLVDQFAAAWSHGAGPRSNESEQRPNPV